METECMMQATTDMLTDDVAQLIFSHIPNSDKVTCRSVSLLSRRLSSIFFSTRRKLALRNSAQIASWCTSLEELKCLGCASGLAFVRALPFPNRLRRLYLDYGLLQPDDVPVLAVFSTLRSLQVRSGCLICNQGILTHVSSSLVELDVSGDPPQSVYSQRQPQPRQGTLSGLEALHNLQTLIVNYNRRTPIDDMACLPPSLTRLEVEDAVMQDTLDLRYLTNLRDLNLNNNPDVFELQCPLTLQSLQLNNCKSLSECYKWQDQLQDLCSLTRLSACDLCLEPEDIRIIIEDVPTALLSLDVGGSYNRKYVEDLEAVCNRLPHLRELNFSGCGSSYGAGDFAALTKLTALTKLLLYEMDYVGEFDFEVVGQLTALKVLDLSDPFDNSECHEELSTYHRESLLDHLTRLTQLEELNLEGFEFEQGALDWFLSQLPRLGECITS